MPRLPILALLALLVLPGSALAANDKIDPATYLCAELVSNELVLQNQPPLFEGLQMDGYVSASISKETASPDTVFGILSQVVGWCQSNPTEKVITPWQQMRSTGPDPEGEWVASKTTCADFALNQDDASGFIIWLDGYNRKLQNTDKSILNSDDDVRAFIDACLLSPKKTMLQVLQETAK